MQALRSLAPASLRELPSASTEHIRVEGKKVMLTVYREQLAEDRTAVIVQMYRRVFLFYGRMLAIGFIVERDGSLTEPDEKLLWDYT
jgi:hypothetical protein